MESDTSKPTAKLVKVPVETADAKRINAIKAEAHRYPYSPVFQETIELLKKQTKVVEQEQVQVTMPKETAEKLYGLLGQISRHDGFNDVFDAFNNANFVLRRQRPRITFLRDNVIHTGVLMVTINRKPASPPPPPQDVISIEMDLLTAKAMKLALRTALDAPRERKDFVLNLEGKRLVQELKNALNDKGVWFDDSAIASF